MQPMSKAMSGLILTALLATCRTEPSTSPEVAADLADTPSCVETAQKVGPTVIPMDIDGDGSIENVEIFENATDADHSLLARWRPVPGGARKEAVWAVATHILVKLQPGTSPAAVWPTLEELVDRDDLEYRPASGGSFLVRLPPNKSGFHDFGASGKLLTALSRLRNDHRVVWAEPDYLFFTDDREPTDFMFQRPSRFRFAFDQIKAPAAWVTVTGSKTVTVAVLDTGASPKHIDLKPNLVAGWNVITGKPDTTDNDGHGSYCAGLIGAQGGDTPGMLGMVGVNWNVSLMPVKFIDRNDCGTSANAASAVDFAADHGASIISASWGGLGKSQTLLDAIARAENKKILFVASAGNTGLDLESQDYFPASYALSNMIVVGASDDNDDKLLDSGYGTSKVHLSAPGEHVPSAGIDVLDPYKDGNGTSPAVALVAGAAALIKAKDPSMILKDLRCRLLQATDPLSGLTGASCSGGRLNVNKAVKGGSLLRSVPSCGCP